MFVRNSMVKPDGLITVQADDTLAIALQKIESNNFLSIPVVNNNAFYGVIFKERIYREFFNSDVASKEQYLNNSKVIELASTDIPFAYENQLIEEVAFILKESRIPFVPVLNNEQEKKFVGIITHTVIFDRFTDLFGTKRGYRLALSSFDMKGQLAKLTELIYRSNGNIISLVVIDPHVMGVMQIVVRVETSQIDKLKATLKESGFKIAQID
jgi:acetoin utilization protein AcuB